MTTINLRATRNEKRDKKTVCLSHSPKGGMSSFAPFSADSSKSKMPDGRPFSAGPDLLVFWLRHQNQVRIKSELSEKKLTHSLEPSPQVKSALLSYSAPNCSAPQPHPLEQLDTSALYPPNDEFSIWQNLGG